MKPSTRSFNGTHVHSVPAVAYQVEEVVDATAVEADAPQVNTRTPKPDAAVLAARAVELVHSGRTDIQARDMLMEEYGLSRSEAYKVVTSAIEAASDNGMGDMLAGALWCIGGIVVTVGTYEAAGPGDTFIIAWGAILFGGLQFLKGLFGFLAS